MRTNKTNTTPIRTFAAVAAVPANPPKPSRLAIAATARRMRIHLIMYSTVRLNGGQQSCVNRSYVDRFRQPFGREELSWRVEAKLWRALHRFGTAVTAVEVHIGDDNAAKPGESDKRSSMVAPLCCAASGLRLASRTSMRRLRPRSLHLRNYPASFWLASPIACGGTADKSWARSR